MAQTSSINPNIPAQFGQFSSADMRAQFLAAIDDIDELFLLISQQAPVQEYFTGAVTFGGANAGIAVIAEGAYSLAAGVVTVLMHIVLTAKGTSTGQFAISGFPPPMFTQGVRLACGPWSQIGGGDISAILTGDTVTIFNGPPNGISAPITDADILIMSGPMVLNLSGSYLAGSPL